MILSCILSKSLSCPINPRLQIVERSDLFTYWISFSYWISATVVSVVLVINDKRFTSYCSCKIKSTTWYIKLFSQPEENSSS